jgi:hypothetical protein
MAAKQNILDSFTVSNIIKLGYVYSNQMTLKAEKDFLAMKGRFESTYMTAGIA